jgi:hypothetical protein
MAQAAGQPIAWLTPVVSADAALMNWPSGRSMLLFAFDGCPPPSARDPDSIEMGRLIQARDKVAKRCSRLRHGLPSVELAAEASPCSAMQPSQSDGDEVGPDTGGECHEHQADPTGTRDRG